MSAVWWIVYAIIAIVVIGAAAVAWATVDRRRGRSVQQESGRIDQPREARRGWRR